MNLSCANPDCKAELKYLRGGRLFLMERRPNVFHMQPRDAAPVKRPVTMRRYFWLCESCSQVYTIQRWTDNGIELASRPMMKRMPTPVPTVGRDWAVPGLVG
ncbi:MAG TPA: hypothetical protein VN670_04790 [Acidobacteriaceae bacterium]|nr:hypothetical protein [Acidobacteriaceae bacterium]